MVLPHDPPDISMPGPIASYSFTARSASISVITPLGRSCRVRNASSVCANTSTMAFPTPSTSKSPFVIPRPFLPENVNRSREYSAASRGPHLAHPAGADFGISGDRRALYRDLIRTLRQVTAGRFARVVPLSLVLAQLHFAALLAGVAWVLPTVALVDTAWLGTHC